MDLLVHPGLVGSPRPGGSEGGATVITKVPLRGVSPGMAIGGREASNTEQGVQLPTPKHTAALVQEAIKGAPLQSSNACLPGRRGLADETDP